MGVISRIKSWFAGGGDYGLAGVGWASPSPRNTQGYYQAYKEVGVFYAAISRIATAVGEANWHLYRVNAKGKRTEIFQHPILKLLKYANPFQTRNELFELTQLYLDVAGEAFWSLAMNKLGMPGEVWVVPPELMHIIPDKDKFIGGYEYRGGQTVKFKPEEIIMFKYPDPSNPWRGTGPAQAVGTDLDIEKYTREWEARFFYNNATPAGILEIPGVSDEDLKAFKAEWQAKYGSWRNAHKLAFLNAEGIKFTDLARSQREMDFWRSSKANRDRLLLGLGIPLSIMGISENVNRANAEAGNFVFSRWVVRPRLVRIREKLNEQLVPRYGEDLVLDFEDPVPESQEVLTKKAESGVKAGYLTVNEARQLQGFDPVPNGDILLIPMNMLPQPIKGAMTAPPPQAGQPEKAYTESQKEAHWKAYVSKTEGQEKPFVSELGKLWAEQEDIVLDKLQSAASVEDTLFDVQYAQNRFRKVLRPLLGEVLEDAAHDAENLISPKAVRQMNPEAEKWLDERALWLVREINHTTRDALRATLKEGFKEGESIPKLSKRIRDVYADCNKRRATVIARTEVIAASNEGALTGYKATGVEQAEFFAALDERLCEECMALHGKIYELKDASGVIPVHPQCRCTWLPVV